MKWRRQTKYTLGGVAFGMLFPLSAWAIDIFQQHLFFSLDTVLQIHQQNALHYIIDSAPFILGLCFFVIGHPVNSLSRLNKTAMAEIMRFSEQLSAHSDIDSVQSKILRIISHTLEVERVGLWYYSESKDWLILSTMYLRSKGSLVKGATLKHSQYPDFFSDLDKDINIVSYDVRQDSRLRAFKTGYMNRYNISSMLTVPIRVSGVTTGVICLEHTGTNRHWRLPEQEFIKSVTLFFALMRESYQRMKSDILQKMIMNTMSDGLIIINSAGNIDSLNPAAVKMFAYPVEEGLGRHYSQLLPDLYSVPYIKDFLQGRSTENAGITDIEIDGVRQGGQHFPVIVSLNEMRIGPQLLYNCVIRDITELKIKETALQQAKKMEAVGQLTGGIAHDFNNLLAIINGNLRFLEQDFGVIDANTQELFNDARSAIQDGSELTRRLLAFSSKQQVQTQNNNVNQVLERFKYFISRTIGDNIQLKLDLPEQALFIMTNPSQLQNALLNLAINARDAMVSGGTIMLSATRYYHTNTVADLKPQLSLAPGSYVVISVSDNGIGIPAEQLPHVFEPFYTTKELGKGTGLGLSMLYNFTQQSMGACYIESTVDLGTRVEMVFPEYLEENNTTPAADDKPITETGIATDKIQLILVVEDEPRVLKLTLRDLKYLGYATIAADNAAMARQIIESGKEVDLLLTDIQMPGEWDGHRLADWVRTNYPQIKIILASGYSKEPSQHAEEGRGFPLLRKPYSLKVMAEMIRAEQTG